MLFNSYVFIFLFLPLTVVGFYSIGTRLGGKPAITWLVLASLFFYGWWNPAYLWFIVGSIIMNYSSGLIIGGSNPLRRFLLVMSISANLCLLGYFKYSNFFVDNINLLIGSSFNLEKVVLPLAISFFTFQQITYLVDTFQRKIEEHSFLNYCLFVTFFPQLIAGPIVHHREMLPQFTRRTSYRPETKNLSVGLTIFSLGLFKKVVLADSIAFFVAPVFDLASLGSPLSFVDSWIGALSYALQLYFDFSGYSDMAIGLGLLFGIKLPINFNSPYKSHSIEEFWKRWHMTLSRFFRDYIYIPLGGNRKGSVKQCFNLMSTMLLGGLWHGAGWTFVFWGGLHGIYLVVNYGYRFLISRNILRDMVGLKWRFVSVLVTFLAVVVGWVFFRADNLEAAMTLIKGLSLLNGFAPVGNFSLIKPVFEISILLAIVWFLPNTQQFMTTYAPAVENLEPITSEKLPNFFAWVPSSRWAFTTGAIMAINIFFLARESVFLYFQF